MLNRDAVQNMVQAGRLDLLQYGKAMNHPRGYVAGQLELTSACEQQCVNCQSWIDHRKGIERGEWGLGDLQRFHSQLASIDSFEHLTLTGGDPQSYPHLELFMHHHLLHGQPFGLRLNTALPLPIRDHELWRASLTDLRVSLDGVDPDYYARMRGVRTNPNDILQRMVSLSHPRLSTLTCVSLRNIDHVPEIVKVLQRLREEIPFRKAIFIPVRDMNDRALIQLQLRPETYQDKWMRLRERYADLDWTSFGEQVEEGELANFKGVGCQVARITFHVKANGDLYTCCLMGGEAIATRREYRLGNVQDEHIHDIWTRTVNLNPPRNVYDDPQSPCTKICLWKQASMNLLAHQSEDMTLAMP